MNTDLTVQDHWLFESSRRCSKFHMVTNTQETFRDSSQPAAVVTCLGSREQPLYPAPTPRALRAPSLTAALQGRKSKQIWPIILDGSHWKKDFNVAGLHHPTSSVSVFCTHIKMMFCTIPLHTGLLAIQESQASSQIFLFLLDKTKSPQTRLQRAKAFANIVNAFSYLKYNVYFTSKIFRLN